MRTLAKLVLASPTILALSVQAEYDPSAITPQCEEALALSALPLRLRDQASAYVLKDGEFELVRTGDGPFTCIVARNHPQSLIPQCADGAGRDTIIPGIIMKSSWALDGATPEEYSGRFDKAAASGTLKPPSRSGVSYMMSNFNFVWDWSRDDHFRIPPHVMYYAPNLKNDDIGGSQMEGMGTNRGVPFVIEEGIHGYMISMVEKTTDSADVLQACAGQLPTDNEQIDLALNSPLRTDADRDLDASRKPREFLDFLGVREGNRVAEINAGAGYNARLLSSIVGDSGYVYATNAEFVLELFDGINERLRESVKTAKNIGISVQTDDMLVLPTLVDVAILNNNYHDLHWQEINTAKFNAAVFEALKPGGVFVIGDHSASEGSGTSRVGDIHRIEESFVIQEVEAAGFELIASASFLANPNDDRQSFIIDPAIRGNTDRFLLKFQRPKDM